jgi:uncharacterized protein (TIGR03546 family)
MILLRLIQKMIKALHSEGTPGQVAAGIALGSAFGFVPLLSLFNLCVLALVTLLNVSFPGAMLGMVVFTPIAFFLDPVFDTLGTALLTNWPGLTPIWTTLYNTPFFPLTSYNNTVVLGSLVGWIILVVPLFFAMRFGVGRYRASVAARVEQSRFVKAVKASGLYTVYRWFRP